ncbi:MAG: MMPL family transporter [Candidatus Poseidoniales archaeon]|nr:MMPL family transporter [Candidatus Poseidoniales archaeon]
MKEGVSDDRTSLLISVFEKGSPALLFAAVVVTLIFGLFLFPLPSFHTDLDAFAPDGPNDETEKRIEEAFGNERIPLFVHVKVDDGSNVLSIESLVQQQSDLDEILAWSESHGPIISEYIAIPDIIQRGLDDKSPGAKLSEATSWEQLLNETLDEGQTCADGASNNELLMLASFGRDALLNKDLQFESTTCMWLDSNRTSGDATPFATSNLWILYIRPDLEDESREKMVNLLRQEFDTLGEQGNLSYGLISDDVLSHDINEGTIDNLVWLIAGALLVVVIILAFAFRSARGVLFPLAALSMAIVWTYGALAAITPTFSVLHVAVAPVVLGLGIDYSIHLQRSFEKRRSEGSDTAEAWALALNELYLALTLTVITTVAAFLSNVVSPLPPVRSFGLALAFGVVSAFITSTIVVGSMHVLMEKSAQKFRPKSHWDGLKVKAREVVITQRKTQAFALIFVVMLTVTSVIAAAAKLETEFDLTDFLDDEMEVMQVRTDIYESYEATGWRPIYILSEPMPGEVAIIDDLEFIEATNLLNHRLELAPRVVIPRAIGDGQPMIESIHTVLRDAIEKDAGFGNRHGLRVIGNDLAVIRNDSPENDENDYNTGDAVEALIELSENQSVGNALTGATWSQRVSGVSHLSFDEQNGCSNGCLLFMRTEIMVQVSSNSESVEAVEGLETAISQSSGKYGVQAAMFVSGDAVRLNLVLEGLTTSQLESTVISLIVSTIVLFALTRRIGLSIIVVTPVAIAAIWVVGAMALLNLNWNVLTVMVTALTIGLGIDYSIHVWRKYEDLKERLEPWEAVKEMHATTGVALLLSAGTSICGFLVLRLSPMPVVQDFGVVTSLTVFFSLALALGLMPLLLTADSLRDNGNAHID